MSPGCGLDLRVGWAVSLSLLVILWHLSHRGWPRGTLYGWSQRNGSESQAAWGKPIISAEKGNHTLSHMLSPEGSVKPCSYVKGSLAVVKLTFLLAMWHSRPLLRVGNLRQAAMALSLALPLLQGADQTEALI